MSATQEPCSADTPPPTPVADALVAAIALGCEAGAVAVGGDSVWIVPHRENVVLRVDPATNEVASRVSLGDRGPGAEIAANDEMVWASVSSPSFDLERLVRIDPATANVVASVDMKAGSPVIGGGAVWATGPEGVYQVDVESNTVAATFDVGECRVVADRQRVWCIAETAVRLDPGSGRATPAAGGEQLGWPLLFAEGLIWGISQDGLWAFDPGPGAITVRLAPPDGVASWAPDAVLLDGALWVAASSSALDPFASPPDRLVHVDPAKRAVGCVLEIPNPEHGIGAGSGAIWLPVLREPWLLRLEPRC